MSARERLIGELVSLGEDRCINQAERDDCAAVAEKLVDAFAHELAERIRAAILDGGLDASAYGDHGNVLAAANLVDPIKESDRG